MQVTELHRKLVLWLEDFLWCDSRLLVLWVSQFYLLVDQFPICMMAFASPIEVDFCCSLGGCLTQEIRSTFWLNSLCGRMFEAACDNELHCIDGWPHISLISWKSRLKERDLDLLSWTICSHWFWTQPQVRIMLFMTPGYSQYGSSHAASLFLAADVMLSN